MDTSSVNVTRLRFGFWKAKGRKKWVKEKMGPLSRLLAVGVGRLAAWLARRVGNLASFGWFGSLVR